MCNFEIRQDDLSGAATRKLLELHLGGMRADSPPGHVFALDLTELTASNVTVWSAWRGGELAGIAALKLLPDRSGELKSMRTAPSFLRQGVGAALLRHIIDAARARDLKKLSLETGSGPAFEPALKLYRKHGFRDGGAFADYVSSDFNQFLHLDL